ncbi:MAG: selenocysteine-specific translation elongation factor [SAR202 cluster bacterium]|nr:selenocysteine-specific translation elongation factor [Chloroflexota bacterium]MCS5654844.1 selenocysteine-specific translation elongation factor [Dehalococcoidia bacterium]MQG48944.1 selenocysteine-specific translation elongation factor [SAR202 cluster bacterium]MQG79883.1 selenocysteine-specific translation elongation factor [SAR202 cluster bacterium]|tara:strand:+ start:827 stop:2692 length:1866 start_codon:yes stop_codon:yes gene_type:complete
MYVIGTAGHVDHGKSTLVKALTGIDPDRFPEEKAREMTIDLGFAWMALPSGREVSIVDVPGHERFIKNMLAGVGAIDLALLIVAADESVMPQTREHLAILDILQITRGLVVVTKTDLVDEELVDLVKAEVEDTLQGTSFEGCPMVGVSAYTGDGLEELKATMDSILDETDARQDLGRPRLPIDRCFTISGFGTVVTGTLIDGTLTVGQEIELAGSGQRARVRGLQSHKTKVDATDPGVRLAVNLSGLSKGEVERGEILTIPGWLKPTYRLDARLRMVKNAPNPLKHNQGVTFHLFTSEASARVRLLDADRLTAGQEGWVQLLLADPLPAVKGDFFVIRSSEDTLGGGQIVDPNPRRRYRRFDDDVIDRLMTLDQGTGGDIIISVAEQWGPCDMTTLSQRTNLSPEEVTERVSQLTGEGHLVSLGEFGGDADAVVYSAQGWGILKSKVASALQLYHTQYPLRHGVPAQEIRSRLNLSQPVYQRALARLVEEQIVVDERQSLRLPDHEITLTPKMEEEASAYLNSLQKDPYSPPSDQRVSPELLGVLIDQGKVVRVTDGVIFDASAYREMTERIVQHLKDQGNITVAEARTMFNTSRKYILPLLEHMDQQQITRRTGDERVLR